MTTSGPMSRRELLWTGVTTAVVGAGMLASPPHASGTSARAAGPRQVPADQGPAGAATHVRPARRPSPARHRRPSWDHRWHTPIYSIDDFLRGSRGTHMPHRAIMLTIDDGPSPYWTPRFLRLLAKHHVRATFCMIGEQVHANRHLVKAVAHDGHHIANHTWTHDEQLPYRSAARIRREIVDTNDAIVRASGFVPRQFRAPGGVWGPRVYAELARQQMMPLGWDIDPRDWALPGTWAIESAMLAAGRHDIILCHDGGGDRSQTYAALEYVLPLLKRRGLEFVLLPAPQQL